MFRLFLGLLSVLAIALFINNAIAGNKKMQNNNNNGVMIIETMTSSSTIEPSQNTSYMQPLPQDPGVEVGPQENMVNDPVMVEEDMYIEETQDGE